MPRKKGLNNRIMVRLDDETEWSLAQFAKKHNVPMAEAARIAIKHVVLDDTSRRIADRLDEIDRRLLAASTTAQIEKLSQQFVALAESNNTNTNRIAGALHILIERG